MVGNDGEMENNNLAEVRRICQEYVDRPDCVFKSCLGKYLVVMATISETVTNESRKVSNKFRAKYRANILQVLFIVNMYDTTDRPTQIINNDCFGWLYSPLCMMYKVGELAIPNTYTDMVDIICGYGVHYFKIWQAIKIYI